MAAKKDNRKCKECPPEECCNCKGFDNSIKRNKKSLKKRKIK